MSQIGFIMVGAGSYAILGDGGVLSARGLVLHMVNHSMIKLVLFMAAGVIFMNLHKLDLNDIRGWGRKKPLLKVCFGIGALSISGVPLFSGYISKTLLHEGIPLPLVEVLFLICGGMTLSYMLKIFIAVFVEENNDAVLQAKYDSQTSYWNMASRIAVCVPAAMLFVMGILPYQIMDRIAELCADFLHVNPDILSVSEVRYFAGEKLLGSMISIVVGLVLYFLVIRTRLMKTVARDDMEKGVRAEAGEGTEVAASGEAVEGTDSVAVRANVKEATEGSGVETVRAEAKKTCSIYVDKWPKRLDLEDMIYRPFVLKVLPGAVGFICAVTGQITDSLIILLRRTIFRQVSTKVSTEEMDDHLAIVMAGFLDKHFPKKDGTSRVPAYVTAEEGLARTQRMISSALSFGLILVCVGLILVLIYTLASA
jgi:hydrogenase-4 component B